MLCCRPAPRERAGVASGAPVTASDAAPPGLRRVRVLLGSDVESLRVRAARPMVWKPDSDEPPSTWPPDESLQIEPVPPSGMRVGGDVHRAHGATIQAEGSDAITLALQNAAGSSPELRYPGSIRMVMDDDGLFRVINHVDVEQYVAGVVAAEAWPTFEEEVFRVQAIVARTFVLYQMQQAAARPFDVTATQGAQVYRGLRDDVTGRRATEAAQYTRGIACTFEAGGRSQLFCTYYSAACGGASQAALLFSPEGDIEPLAGSVACDYCKIAPKDTYRWGPVRVSKHELQTRLLARYPELQSVGELTGITPIEKTADGRLLSLRLIGSGGQFHDMLAERFRLAVGGMVMRSTACDIRLTDQEVILENGRGFGHGLGLCQWGAQGQALAGKRAAEILRYYYPTSTLTRAY